ncbi:cytokine receptor common subunit gamma-like [Boleophthalmus pectinirostris]|uniref:cytokine receptor common subunit gamma-like n=1 Tax=Boleophthalmus pectinirostris TaxID=150288 RepID=UPI0024306CD3|nr:cytokine receptor common subunit gamma-like [Boleophthalmus pectinirostris]
MKMNDCVESQVRYRLNNNNWQEYMMSDNILEYCFNLPSNPSRYELQVRNRVNNNCGSSNLWSEWSEPVAWGAHNKTDVDCMVIGMKYVQCLWNTLDVNYTFYSGFDGESFRECDTYIVKDGLNVGCNQPEANSKLWTKRFETFLTKLQKGNQNYLQEHELKDRVKLDPPSNLTVEYRSDSRLCFKWMQMNDCVESQVRYRLNNNNWQEYMMSDNIPEYCFNLPSNSSRYELQVRNRVNINCGSSNLWSEWSEPVAWGAHNMTYSTQLHDSVNVWTVVMYFVGGAILLLLIVMLLHHERIRIILIPVVPKPSHDLEEWLDNSKGLKEVFKTSYTEHTCSVQEYCPVPLSDSESSDSSIISVSTDQTDCYNNIPNPDLSHPGPSSSSAEFDPPEEQHVSV